MPERIKPFLRELAVEQDIDLEQLQQEDAIWPWLADDAMADYQYEPEDRDW